jgi:16S rRNA (guanine1516-N2)-methyltransferase
MTTPTIKIDFAAPALLHRLQFGGGKKQLLGRAIGCHKHKGLSVIDATAGLGRDACVLASLGCHVTMLERHPIIAAALEQALQEAQSQKNPIASHLRFIADDANNHLRHLAAEDYPDVIYFDPMFPHRDKAALVKKDMQQLQQLVGADYSNENFLPLARACARYRVVVKRHRHAPSFHQEAPDFQYLGKSSRFDIYLPTSQQSASEQTS